MANIVITGVTTGIGFALAKELARLGNSIIGCGRNVNKLEQLTQELGNSHLFTKVDVRNHNEVAAWAKLAYKQYHKIDIIINNSGIKNASLPLWQVSATDFEDIINTNIVGVANVIRSFVPNMIRLNHGIIINMSSEWGRIGDALVASYCASKFAIEGLNQSLAKELPSEMITIALSPLIVLTDLLEQCKDLLLPGEYELGVPPDEWAQFIVPKIFALKKSDNGKSLTWHPKAL